MADSDGFLKKEAERRRRRLVPERQITMMVLGIDPSYTMTGLAVVQDDVLYAADVVDGRGWKDKTDRERIDLITASVTRFADEFRGHGVLIDRVAIETPYENHKNPRTYARLVRLGEGIERVFLGDVVRVAPAQAKKAATGHGQAQKCQVVYMVEQLFGAVLSGTKAEIEAKADAVAVAMAGRAGYK